MQKRSLLQSLQKQLMLNIYQFQPLKNKLQFLHCYVWATDRKLKQTNKKRTVSYGAEENEQTLPPSGKWQDYKAMQTVMQKFKSALTTSKPNLNQVDSISPSPQNWFQFHS